MAGNKTLVTFIIIVYVLNLLWSILIVFSLTGWFTRGKKDWKIDELRAQVMDLQKSMDAVDPPIDTTDPSYNGHTKDKLSNASKQLQRKKNVYLNAPTNIHKGRYLGIFNIQAGNKDADVNKLYTRSITHSEKFKDLDKVLVFHVNDIKGNYKHPNVLDDKQEHNLSVMRDKYQLLYERQTDLLTRMLRAAAPRAPLAPNEIYGMFLVSFLLNLVLLAMVSSLASDDAFTPGQKSNGQAIQAIIGILCVSDLLVGLFMNTDNDIVKWLFALLNLATTIAYGVYAGVVYYRD